MKRIVAINCSPRGAWNTATLVREAAKGAQAQGAEVEYLGLTGGGEIQVVNLKCDTRLIDSFREEPGIFPGWHMNKAHWLSVALDGSVDDEKIRFLVDMSYELTKK